jgi:hypothetical protein
MVGLINLNTQFFYLRSAIYLNHGVKKQFSNSVVITIFQLFRSGQFYWWRKPEYPEKIADLSQVIDNIMLYRKVGVA